MRGEKSKVKLIELLTCKLTNLQLLNLKLKRTSAAAFGEEGAGFTFEWQVLSLAQLDG